jgi:hypothetical protein
MKKILCLTDFSQGAYSGIVYANNLAKANNSTLIFMHGYKVGYKQENQSLNPSEAREKLNHLCMLLRRENRYSQVNYEYIVKEGELLDNVNEIIHEQLVDLVVVSKEGERSPDNERYSDVIINLSEKTHCPVITVPSAHAFRTTKEMIYVLDIDNTPQLDHRIIEFAKLNGSHITLLCFDDYEDKKRINRLRVKLSSFKESCGYDNISLEIKASVNPFKCLLEFIEYKKADIVAFDSHPSATQDTLDLPIIQYLFTSQVPVLLMHKEVGHKVPMHSYH